LVQEAPHFPEVLQEFKKFLIKNNVAGQTAIFMLCGSWDLEHAFVNQCHLSTVTQPQWSKSWIDLKSEFERTSRTYINRSINDLLQMMEFHNVSHEGKLHSGKDDVENIIRLAKEMCKSYELQGTQVDTTFSDEYVFPPIHQEEAKEKVEEIKPKIHRGPQMCPSIKVKWDQAAEKKFEQVFDYILIINFQETCLRDMAIDPPEIIEFPCLVWDVGNRKVVATFHSYVKPVLRPRLSPFCIRLTRISQRTVDVSDSFPDVYKRFLHWLDSLDFLKGNKKWTFATNGDGDLKKRLPAQMKLSGIQKERDCFDAWIDIRKTFQRFTGKCLEKNCAESSLEQMLMFLGMIHFGHIHSGLCDVHNAVRVLDMLLHLGTLKQTV